MDRENVVHFLWYILVVQKGIVHSVVHNGVFSVVHFVVHNGILFSWLKNDIMKFSGKWMQLERIILSEVAQT